MNSRIFIKSKKVIKSLFNDGEFKLEYPFFYRFLKIDSSVDFRFVVNVKKKHFPKAVDRNKIKRLIRDSIRQSILELKNKVSENQKAYHIAIIYNSNNIYDNDYIKDKINLILLRLIGHE